jgi:hypothetical protein
MERPMKASDNSSDTDINNRLNELRNQRNENNTNQQPQPHTVLTTMTLNDLESVKGETNKKYQELLAARGETLPLPLADNNIDTGIPQKQKKQKPKTQTSQKKDTPATGTTSNTTDEFNILPFTINEDFSDQATNIGQPLYINSDQLLDTSSDNVKSKYDDLQKMRNNEIQEFLTYQHF